MKISSKAASLSPSLTLALTAKAKEMKASGIDVISFGAGEPDFDTPDFIKEAAIEDLRAGVTKYTAAEGTPELRKAVCEVLRRDYALAYSPADIVVSCGGKHSLYNIFYTLLDEGDEVVLPAPYWLSYPEQVRAVGGTCCIVDCPPDAGFKITPEQLRKAITPRTVAFVLNSPSNPTGAVYTKAELLALGEVLLEHPKVTIISDDLYQKLVYQPAEFHSLPALVPALKERTIIVNGLSKAYSMTGWRIGWAAGPRDVMQAMANFQSHSTSNITSFTQRAAAVALLSDHSFLDGWRRTFDERRRLIVRGLNEIAGVRCAPEPLGAFYAFPDISGTFGTEVGGRLVNSALDLSAVLLEKARVAVVPGESFGEPRCVRLSYATSETAIREGNARIREFLGSRKS